MPTSPDDVTDSFRATTDDSPPYHRDGGSVHALVYYILLVTRRRRPLFKDEPAKTRVAELLLEAAEEMGLRVECVDVNPATVTVHVQAPPKLSPHMIVRNLRRSVVAPLREEFEHIRSSTDGVFVRDYMVTSMPVPDTDCDAFERHIPKRWVPKGEPEASAE